MSVKYNTKCHECEVLAMEILNLSKHMKKCKQKWFGKVGSVHDIKLKNGRLGRIHVQSLIKGRQESYNR